MSIVGIICDVKYESHIEQVLNRTLQNKTIFILKEDNIQNFKNISFETIVIFSKNNTLAKSKIVRTLLEKAKYLIIDADEKIGLDLKDLQNLKVITYGFNSKSTITASSVTDEDLLICVQRNIMSLNKKEIEPQEILVKNIDNKLTTNIMMGIVTILLIYCFPEVNLK